MTSLPSDARRNIAGETAPLKTASEISSEPPAIVSGGDPERQGRAGYPLWLAIGFWGCVVIAVAVVVRRLVALAHPSQGAPPQMAALDAGFSSDGSLTG